MNPVTLPQVIRKEIRKLPDAVRDVVAQRLRSPPPPPVTYESAVRHLSEVMEVEEIWKKGFLAAEALALWAKVYDDNRALVEAQKIKAFALRQMFLAAKELGDPYRVLVDRQVSHQRIQRAGHLASYPTKEAMDSAADLHAGEVRIDHLVGAVERASPSFREMRSRNLAQQKATEQAHEEAQSKPLPVSARVTAILWDIEVELKDLEAERALLSALPKAHRAALRVKVAAVADTLDRIDEFLERGNSA